MGSDYAIYELTVPDEWNGRTVGALDIRKRYNLNILVVRGDELPNIAVSSDTLLRVGQTILVLGKWKDVQKCFKI